MIDSTDKDRIDDSNGCDSSAMEELHRLLAEDELQNHHLLVFANKQDLPNAMEIEEIILKMQLHKLKNRKWCIQGSCAYTGDGLYEGLDWLSNVMQNKPNEHEYGNLGAHITYKEYPILIENRKKSILVVNGFVRQYNAKYKLQWNVEITRLIHKFYQDPKKVYDKSYTFNS